MTEPLIRLACLADLAALHPVIERAYRTGAGWTHEAELVVEPRTDPATLAAVLAAPRERLLVARLGERVAGCVQVSDRGGGLAALGLLAVDPEVQAGGIGRRLIAAAETCAADAFAARRMEMSVIAGRAELIRYYARRGYLATGEERPFPVPGYPHIRMAVLARALG